MMTIENTTTNDIKNIIEAQREFFASNATLDIEFRKKQLKKMRDALKKWEKPLLEALWLDLHKSNEVGNNAWQKRIKW